MNSKQHAHVLTMVNVTARKLARAFLAWRDALRAAQDAQSRAGVVGIREIQAREKARAAAEVALSTAEDEFRQAEALAR